MSETPEIISQWRWLMYLEKYERLELRGSFTSSDLRLLADWLDTEDYPTDRAWHPILKGALSPIVPDNKGQ